MGQSGLLIASLLCLLGSQVAYAHPMGNFAICHYAHFTATREGLHLRYILDMAEIPTITEKETLTPDRTGVPGEAEKTAYLNAKAREIEAGIVLKQNDRPVKLGTPDSDVRLSPGAGGLETLKIILDWRILAPKPGASYQVRYQDNNYTSRTGWKEVVATAGPGAAVSQSTVPETDQSQELSFYPTNIVPPQVTEARFRVLPASLSPLAALTTGGSPGARTDRTAPVTTTSGRSSSTPRDAFTQSIASRKLTPGLLLGGLVIACLFGAFHALSPGHGKAMVAAYLVGSRGTVKHAVLLGIIVTITHTLGVFALGLITLFASRYIVPEKLYPVLSLISGVSVCGVGVWLLYTRLRGLDDSHEEEDYGYAPANRYDPSYDFAASHVEYREANAPGGNPMPAQENNEGASNGFGRRDIAEGPLTVRSLLALGISGGIVPCPSALVVLLSAIALHRVAYGMLLIMAFSVGLASVLIGIGLVVVSARQWVRRLSLGGAILQRLPIASAAAITLIGILLIVRALGQGTP